MKLYRVSVDYTLDLVIAADEPPTWDTIHSAAEDEIADNGIAGADPGFPTQITSLREIPSGWLQAVPRGDHEDDRTCAQIIDDDPGILLTPFGQQLKLPRSVSFEFPRSLRG